MFKIFKMLKPLLIYVYYIPTRLRFRQLGKGARLFYPGRFENPQFIEIRDNAILRNYAWVQALQIFPGVTPSVTIGEGSNVNRFSHIVATHKVQIGRKCGIADNVFIADTTHSYEDINIPEKEQPLKFLGEVIIGDSSWIGRNVSILGAQIGKHCVIGTNTVVTKNIPDYCVVVGNPCKIIKRYNFETKQWEKTDKDGKFLPKDN